MTVRPLPISTPAAQGVDSRGIHAFLDAIEIPDVDPHSLMVLRHGHVVAAGWWAPYTPDRLHLLYSLSKSFTSAALGLALAEARLGLDDPVVGFFPQWQAEITDARTRTMRVRHIASMATGHLVDTWGQAVATDPADPVRGFLLLPPDREPGTVFAYNQPATYALGAIIQRVTGQRLTDYLRPRLLDPLGAGEVSWQQYPAGRDLGFTGLHATTDAVARLGLLHLQGGSWAGRQLLSNSWVADATRSHIGNPGELNADWQQGYGFQFWRARHGYRGDGAYGQFCLVLPEQDMVVAITAASQDMQYVLDAVWEHLLPAVGFASGRDAELADRLAALAIPPASGSPSSLDDGQTVSFAPAEGVCSQQRSLVSVDVAGRQITLHEVDSRLDLRLGTDQWVVFDATAISGGWTDRDTLRVEVIFLETPHRLVITCRLPGRTFTARWVTRPLYGAPLHALRASSGAAVPYQRNAAN